MEFPTYFRFSVLLMGLVALFFILYIGQDILIPILFSMLIAIMLNPLVELLEKYGMNKIIAILLCITIAVFVAAALLYFIGSQLSLFSESLPVLKERFSEMFNSLLRVVERAFRLNKEQMDAWVGKLKGDSMDNAMPLINDTISTLTNFIVVIFLLPVYVFMFLFYKPLLLDFISRLFRSRQQDKVFEVLSESRLLIQNYLTGLMVECGLVAMMNTAALIVVGLDYALLLGIIGALLNLIPYIGGIVGIGLPMLLAIVTKSWSAAFWVFVLYAIVQFIDNNIIVPRIVASRVKINGLISIVVVLIGGALWGISGMFLSIPITAILKVIFDRIHSLEPLGYLLGDTMPPIVSLKRKKKKL